MSAGLLAQLESFTAALRTAGAPVSVAEALDGVRAFGAVDLLDRASLRAGLAASLVKRPVHRDAFDALFDLYFPVSSGLPGPPSDEEPDRDDLRDRLAQALLDGDDAELRRLAREAVDGFGGAPGAGQGGRQSWFSYRALRALSPDTLVAGLLDALLAGSGDERGGLAEQVARRTVKDRIDRLRAYVDAEVRRRAAEQRGAEQVARTAVLPDRDQAEFLRANATQLAEMRRAVQPLARRLAARLTARRHLGPDGRLDFRRTVRASLATGGVPVDTKHRPRKPHKPELTVLCDVSGSVAGFAHFTLMLAATLREQFTAVRAFAFIDTCDEVTRLFAPGADLVEATARIGKEASLVWFDGHSDYGHSFEVFAERWPDAVGPKTSLLVLGDGRNNYRDPALPVLRQLVERARHAYWLNPEPARQWGTGDSAALRYADCIEMVECRNVAQLSGFVTRLLPT